MSVRKKFALIWNQIMRDGIQQTNNLMLRKQIILTNQGTIITSLACFFYSFFYMCMGITPAAIACLIFSILSFSCYKLNKLGYGNYSRIIFMSLVNIMVFGFSAWLGNDSGNYLWYFPVISGTFIMFDSKEKRQILFFSALSITSFMILELSDISLFFPLVFSKNIMFVFQIQTFLASAFMTMFCVHYMIKINQENEMALVKEKATLLSLIENMSDTVWMVNRKYEILIQNSVFANIIKSYNIKPGDKINALEIGQKLESISPGIAAYWKSLYDRTFAGEQFVHEHQNDIRNTINEIHFNPVYENNEIVGATVMSRDITERRKQQIELNKSLEENRNLALVASTTDYGVIITDANSKIEWINAGFEKISGYSFNDCVGQHSSDLMKGPLSETLENGENQLLLLQGESVNAELISYRKNKTPFWSSIIITPLKNNDEVVEKFFILTNDISIRKASEMQLKKLVLQNKERIWISTGVAQLADLLRTHQANPAELYKEVIRFLATYTGIKSAAVYLKRNDSFLVKGASFGSVQYDKDTIDVTDDIIAKSIRQTRIIHTTDDRNIRDHKLVVPLHFQDNFKGVLILEYTTQLKDLQMDFLKKSAQSIALTVDLVDRKENQEQLLIHTQQLNKKLTQRDEELRATIKELNEQSWELSISQEELKKQQEELLRINLELEKNHATTLNKNIELENIRGALTLKAQQLETSSRFKSEFLANMSHELRTPLNSIIILSRLLSENNESTLSKKQTEYARVINKSGNDLNALINDILDLSKIEAGKVEMDFAQYTLDEVCNDMHGIFKEIAIDKKINFSVCMDDHLPALIYTDKTRLEQILKNLLSNAFKFTPQNGTITLMVMTDSKNRLLFSVKDSGTGIAPDKQKLIFEAFRQADGSIVREYGGTGLGLSISRELATLLGGEITLQSDEGKGSVFTLALVRNAKNSIENQLKYALIIEDSEMDNSMMKQLLSNDGYQCLAAFTASQGIKHLNTQSFDLVVLDLNLPDADGLQILTYIKETTLKSLPVLVFTGRELTEEESNILKRYSNSIVLKKDDTVKSKIADALRKISDSSNEFTTSTATTSEPSDKLKGKKILLVDDDERNIYALSSILDKYDLEIIKANNGVEALKQLTLNPEIDMVLMDVMMPVMDGLTATQHIREQEQYKYLPIVALTAKAMKGDEQICLQAGVSKYLSKPIDSTKLISIMNSFFQ